MAQVVAKQPQRSAARLNKSTTNVAREKISGPLSWPTQLSASSFGRVEMMKISWEFEGSAALMIV